MSERDGLVARLREGTFGTDITKSDTYLNAITAKAADQIQALKAENQRLRASLQECLEIVESVSDKRAYRALKTRARAALRSTETSHDD